VTDEFVNASAAQARRRLSSATLLNHGLVCVTPAAAGQKARDLRNWLTVYGYWNQGGADNVATMLLYLVDQYLAPTGIAPKAVQETPNTGVRACCIACFGRMQAAHQHRAQACTGDAPHGGTRTRCTLLQACKRSAGVHAQQKAIPGAPAALACQPLSASVVDHLGESR
jgi:hypothetical protein